MIAGKEAGSPPPAAPSSNAPSSNAQRQTFGIMLGFLGMTLFSLTLPMTRLAVAGIDAGTVAVWRGLLAALMAAAILVGSRSRWPRRGQILPLAITGLGVVVGFPVLTVAAMQTVSASHGAVVIGLLPLSTTVVGVIAARERPSLLFWLVSFVGTALTLAFVLRQANGGIAVGHLYLLASVAVAAVGYAVGGRLAVQIGGWRVICWALVLYAPLLGIAACFVPFLPLDASAASLGAFFYLVTVSQLVGFFAWYAGLAMGGIARVSQVQLLQLFMTLAASSILLREELGGEVFIFGALVVACVAFSARLRVRT